jgi:hypothetical protein
MRRTLVSLSALALLCALACKDKGSIQGYVVEPMPASAPPPQPAQIAEEPPDEAPEPAAEQTLPPPKYEEIEFTWKRAEDERTGDIETKFPDGQTFKGQYHQITQGSTIGALESFFDEWYDDPWSAPPSAAGEQWPRYETLSSYITHYSGQVVAILESDRGLRMRCNFELDEPDEGMEGGGWGECQVSNGDRVTAVFRET